ncbi:MAG: cytochrome c [Nitrospina sp.]|jgi:hypothetical protein|nr:cytochrome c [Nitrospina sp.]MBT5985908.1 cytochrome c [Nitrospina sp.]MBT6296956.1 cytochrome c [Nitrospina sp.]
MKKTIIILISIFFTSGFANYKEYRKFSEPVPTSEGQKIFQEMGCPMCHGHEGLGNGFLAQGLEPRPRNFTSFDAMKGVPYQSMYTAIKDGIPFSGMPSFNLSDKQIDDVISYVRSFLTENYITINTCLNTPQVLSLENIDIGRKLEIEKDKPDLVSTRLGIGEITLTPNFEAMRREFIEKRSKLVRVHINLTKTIQDKKKYLAIIALRINKCIK